MKKLILALALTLSLSAHAGNPLQPSHQEQYQTQTQQNTVNVGANGAGGDVKFEDKLQIPNAPGLSSGSSNTTSPNRIYKQRQISTILGGFTNIDMVLDLVAFVKSTPTAREELAACVQDEGFRKLRKAEKNACPKETE